MLFDPDQGGGIQGRAKFLHSGGCHGDRAACVLQSPVGVCPRTWEHRGYQAGRHERWSFQDLPVPCGNSQRISSSLQAGQR